MHLNCCEYAHRTIVRTQTHRMFVQYETIKQTNYKMLMNIRVMAFGHMHTDRNGDSEHTREWCNSCASRCMSLRRGALHVFDIVNAYSWH